MANITQVIVYEKVREVYQFMINASKQRKDIIQYFTKKWKEEGYLKSTNVLSQARTIDNYIKKVRLSYFNFENDIEIEKGRTLARYEDLYAKNIKIQDYKAALQVIKEITELIGIKAPIKTKIDIDIPSIIGVEITDDK